MVKKWNPHSLVMSCKNILCTLPCRFPRESFSHFAGYLLWKIHFQKWCIKHTKLGIRGIHSTNWWKSSNKIETGLKICNCTIFCRIKFNSIGVQSATHYTLQVSKERLMFKFSKSLWLSLYLVAFTHDCSISPKYVYGC